jgi:hypothetical protein
VVYENKDRIKIKLMSEANAILLALKFVASSDKSKFMICSDSLSCLLAIESCKTQNPFISKIVHIYKSIIVIGKHVIFTWIPGHIHGSMGTKLLTGKLIKDALNDSISNCSKPYIFYYEIYFKTLNIFTDLKMGKLNNEENIYYHIF